jgi:hypothetical protein
MPTNNIEIEAETIKTEPGNALTWIEDAMREASSEI